MKSLANHTQAIF